MPQIETVTSCYTYFAGMLSKLENNEFVLLLDRVALERTAECQDICKNRGINGVTSETAFGSSENLCIF